MEGGYQICSKCIMDTTDPDIEFDKNGVCNHCRQYIQIARLKLFPCIERTKRREEIVTKIKKSGNGKKYDCIIGLSGGVDSSYLAYVTWQLGLRPLVVHLDNGWNSELSSRNVENIVNKLDFDLYTYVINWEEFRDLQRSFLKASVLDIEMLTDHAINALLYQQAQKRKIKYILTGTNVVTESVLPRSWNARKSDLKNIKAIHKKLGTIKIRTFPQASTFKILFYYSYFRRIKRISLLNYIDYNKKKAIEILEKELGWKCYIGKHGESIFTKFYQGYILPKKFKIDKRRAHYSNLINSGQMTREEALKSINEEPYDINESKVDKEYVIKKLGFTEEEFEEIMKCPIKSHYDYPSDRTLSNAIFRYKEKLKEILRILKALKIK